MRHPPPHTHTYTHAQYKAETDQYLRQLEAEGRAGEVLGSGGGELVVPEPGIALKTREAGGSGAARVYLNITTSAKLEPLRQRACEDGGRPGMRVEMPMALGAAKQVPCAWACRTHRAPSQRAKAGGGGHCPTCACCGTSTAVSVMRPL